MARRWAGGRDTVNEDLAAFGLAETIEDDSVEIWPENAKIVEVFLAVRTQWIMNDAVILGLSYPGVAAAMEMMGIEKEARPELFDGVQVMEQAAIEALNARKHGS